MTEPQHVVIARLSAEFAAMSRQLARASAELQQLNLALAHRPPPVPVPPPTVAMPAVAEPVPYWHYPPPAPAAARPVEPPSQGWIGKLLAVAGVGVTLMGVALLLVLAAQAGILRPEIRVAAGAALAAALVGAGLWLDRRPGGRVGAVALVATGVAAAYIDVIAVTTIYSWVSAPVGLVIAVVIAGGGLTLSRRWHSEQLGLLVIVPLLVLAPIVTGGVTLLLIGFMLSLAAVSVPVQLGRDWIWLHSARIAAIVLPLGTALVVRYFGNEEDLALAGACALGAALAIVTALVLLPSTAHRGMLALLTTAGVTPLLCVDLAVDKALAALLVAALSATLLAVVLLADRLPGVAGPARQVFAVCAAVAALVAVVTAFDGTLAAPILLAMALLVVVAARRDHVARGIAVGLAAAGGAVSLVTAPIGALLTPMPVGIATGLSVLATSTLLAAVALTWTWTASSRDGALWAATAAVVGYAVTQFCVTAGMLIAADGWGFYAGHMVATICWIAMAAVVFGYALRLNRTERSVPISGGLGLVGAAVAKLFLFDLGALDGMFRVAVFIVVGLILLGMGAGYARLLDRQDQPSVSNNTC
ncbi:hypothetical protein CRI77_03315 [Mycolicibacterium duvalii]|uniref:Uncharacterized protein n=1 Tax=Mycolicibacterium duvalii TaxID=39688 RepID=A0A7I7JY02_9MYCO|nr:DUF2339 domain-containing protein [Mycolicibacterium duvalii]MCV7366884.1 DUF2339 domain-containing protein [Mycolicibacterium duvalii]PEG44047.1 hypothetical protein CRI77_03315 [Mycolicibacterium duvalii]BBX16653.1 hypothetical protein MDUV_15130 [Mycolicibacterium duvalii]